ncbi:MAG: hypothetical protein Q7S27_05700 [Nanoarchaeota archaeon]|nr:hypothetical protein [Nanoarchaeota archaeon]
MDKQGLSESDIYEVLKLVTNRIRDKRGIWRLEGSANLKVQGVDVSVRDLDITANSGIIPIFREALNEYLKKDFYNKKIRANSLIFNINNSELEVNNYDSENLNFFDKIKLFHWKGLEIPILPLKEAKQFYKIINKKEKVDLIESYLKTKKLS